MAGQSGRAETPEQAMEMCLHVLTVRPRSYSELANTLTAKGFREDVAEATLTRLGELGLVDDKAFARAWVRSRHERAGKSRQAIAVELRRKGIEPDIAASALAGIDSDAERDRAGALIRKKLRTMAVGPERTDRDRALRRLVGVLVRRGYGRATALSVACDELARHGVVDCDDPDPDE